MNRIQPWTENKKAPRNERRVEQSLLRSTCRRGQHLAFFGPLHYEEKYAYPLLVWLHGPGDDERQLQRVMPFISMRNYVAVGPRGVLSSEPCPGYTWPDVDADPGHAEQVIFDAIEAAKERFHVAPHRVFLAGYRHGGTLAIRTALRHPLTVAGALTLGGPFPLESHALGHLELIRQLPLFIAAGNDAEEYPIDRTCEELRLFHAAGMSVTIRQYPCDDALTTQMLHDMDGWIME